MDSGFRAFCGVGLRAFLDLELRVCMFFGLGCRDLGI